MPDDLIETKVAASRIRKGDIITLRTVVTSNADNRAGYVKIMCEGGDISGPHQVNLSPDAVMAVRRKPLDRLLMSNVARAIFWTDYPNHSWMATSDDTRALYLARAEAAIFVMSENEPKEESDDFYRTPEEG